MSSDIVHAECFNNKDLNLELSSCVLVAGSSIITYPVERANQLNIVQRLNQFRLLDDVDDRFDVSRNAPIAHCYGEMFGLDVICVWIGLRW